MNDMSDPPRRNSGKTVQQYIDEIPVWADGTAVESMPMTGMQKRIWGLAIAGKFFEGLVVFMTGVALPLIDKDFGLPCGGKQRRHRRHPVRHSDRRHPARRPGRCLRPQAHVHR